MVKEIITYPTTPSLEFGGNVRFFDEALRQLLDDIEDTMEANNLDALAAFQIGSPYSVMVIKRANEYLEIINPRIIKREGEVESVETTAYFPELSAKTKRYKKIKLMYEDPQGKQQFLEADGDLAITIQRKIDYLFGSNFRVRLSNEERKLFDAKLEFGTDAITDNGCPTVFKRDRILHTIRFILTVAFLALFSKFFLSNEAVVTLREYENYAMLASLFLTIIYFFYAQYEGKQYKNCSSCQIGNIIGVTAITLTKLLALFIVNYFLLW
ncbi:peptide deformylase [Sulfurimonas sp.]